MHAHTLSPCIATERIDESRDFYLKHFDARITFDCGWYLNLSLGSKTATLQFITPQEHGPPACNPAGLIYNLAVDDVDTEYQRPF